MCKSAGVFSSVAREVEDVDVVCDCHPYPLSLARSLPHWFSASLTLSWSLSLTRSLPHSFSDFFSHSFCISLTAVSLTSPFSPTLCLLIRCSLSLSLSDTQSLTLSWCHFCLPLSFHCISLTLIVSLTRSLPPSFSDCLSSLSLSLSLSLCTDSLVLSLPASLARSLSLLLSLSL